ncbi:hypothetical protein Tco_0785407 [Tanacetum coccineum]
MPTLSLVLWEAKHQVSFMRILRLREVARATARIALEFAPEFVYQSRLLHHLRLPTLSSKPILSQGGYFGELTRNCQTMPHDPDYVPEPMYPKYIPLEDKLVFPAEEQPLPPVVSPTAESPGYVTEVRSNSRGASISLPPEAKVERLLAMPTPPPSPLISLSPPSARERLTRCTAPSAHSSPPPVPSPLLPASGCPNQIQILMIASTQAFVDAVTAALPSPPLLPLPPSLYIPPSIDCRDDIPESERPPRKRSCLFALGPRYEVEESSNARPTRGRGIDYGFVSMVDAEVRRRGIKEVGYGIRDTWVDPAEAVPKIVPMTLEDVNTRVTELAELHAHDIQDLYIRIVGLIYHSESL